MGVVAAILWAYLVGFVLVGGIVFVRYPKAMHAASKAKLHHAEGLADQLGVPFTRVGVATFCGVVWPLVIAVKIFGGSGRNG